METFPYLSVLTFLPMVGALVILFIPHISQSTARTVALVSALGSLLVSILALLRFDPNAPFDAGGPVPLQERIAWGKEVGASYFLGVDGIAMLLILLTTLLSAIAIVWSWDTINVRTREYYIALLLLETGMLGVFVSLDLFLFYIFWELMLIPMALLIGIWGSTNRVYAAVKFFLYTLFGSLLMLVGIVATYWSYYQQTGELTLSVLDLQQGTYGTTFQIWVFLAFFIAFAVKVPLFPFHTWLPDAHVEAPTAASVILAAVMLKMGGYGFLRFNLPLFEDASHFWQPWIIALSVIAVIYGALVALVQPDMKKLVAYSSVSHMAFVTLGIFVMNIQGMDGAMLVMLAHGFNTGALFLLIGVIYERAHTRLIAKFSGLAAVIPIWAGMWVLFMFASIGLPGLSGFPGEFLVALGTWHYSPILAAFTFSVVIFAAWYMMYLTQRIVWGRPKGVLPDPHDGALTPTEAALLAARDHDHGHGHGHAVPSISGASQEHHDDHGHGAVSEVPGEERQVWLDLSRKELLTLVPLLILTIYVGVYPQSVLNICEPALQRILDMVVR
ncbi:MAG: NADH-quinone oxidoreductase subunit M [Chloroflexota bacterium]|nr:NADH-quinone oxidoreductase subunit M [Chloroflexota bacterium]